MLEPDLTHTGDAVLVVAIARSHQASLVEVFRRHGAAVHALAWRVLRSRSMADDVTQEVFLDLWRRPERFDAGRGCLRGFLLTMTHSRSLEAVRSEVARAARERRRLREGAVDGYDTECDACDLVVADQVRGVLDSLRPAERTAIEMAYLDGLTYRQVAAKLGEPEGTIKSRIRTGLRRMRRTLEQKGVRPST